MDSTGGFSGFACQVLSEVCWASAQRVIKKMAYHDKDLSDMRVLAADDNAINRRFVEGVLSGKVRELVVCEDGRRAIQSASDSQFDVLLLDLHMPGADGVAVMQHIHQLYQSNPELSSQVVPLCIVLTADARKSEQERLLGLGFDGFLSKPISNDELLRGIDNINRRPGHVLEATGVANTSVTGIDTSAALKVLNNDAELLATMREKVLEELPDILNTMNSAISQNNWQSVYEQAHKLAGSCAYTGARALGECCDRLQDMMVSRRSEDTDDLLEPLHLFFELRAEAGNTAIHFLSV